MMKIAVLFAVFLVMGSAQGFLTPAEEEGVRNVIEYVLAPHLDDGAVAIYVKMYEGDSRGMNLPQAASNPGTQCLITSILDKFVTCVFYNLNDQDNIGKCVKYAADTRFRHFTVTSDMVEKMTSAFLAFLSDTLRLKMSGDVEIGWYKIINNVKQAFNIPEIENPDAY